MPLKPSTLGRLTAIAFVLAGSTLLPAAPAAAAADTADLAVEIAGNVINTSGYKATVITVTNRGPGTASGIILDLSESRVDSEAVDGGTVNFCDSLPGTTPPADPPSPDPEAPNRGYPIPIGGKCALADLPAGRSIRLETIVRPWISMGRSIGYIRAAVSHDGTDPVPDNDSAEAPLTIVGWNTDLYVRAWDVPYRPEGQAGSVVPGGTADLRYEVGNPGTVTVTGITLTLKLPEHVVFDASLTGCQYTADRAEATCAYPDLQLAAGSVRAGTRPSAVVFTHEVRVLPSAPAPAVLPDGAVTVELTGATDDLQTLAEPTGPPPALPEGAVAAVAADIDPSDNRDSFAVTTAVADGGGGGLPVTGPSARAVIWLGAALVLVGVSTLILTRRRRMPTPVPPGR